MLIFTEANPNNKLPPTVLNLKFTNQRTCELMENQNDCAVFQPKTKVLHPTEIDNIFTKLARI